MFQEERILVHEAAAALPQWLVALPRHEARKVAQEARNRAARWWNSSDAMLRAAAADIAAALARLSQPEAEDQDCVGGGGGGGGPGDEHAAAAVARGADKSVDVAAEIERLRGMGFDMLVELLLGLGDAHLQVRVACKRATGVVGLVLLGHHLEIATLLKSSALDERWQTDLPNFMHQWLRLLSIHLPQQVEILKKSVSYYTHCMN